MTALCIFDTRRGGSAARRSRRMVSFRAYSTPAPQPAKRHRVNPFLINSNTLTRHLDRHSAKRDGGSAEREGGSNTQTLYKLEARVGVGEWNCRFLFLCVFSRNRLRRGYGGQEGRKERKGGMFVRR